MSYKKILHSYCREGNPVPWIADGLGTVRAKDV